MKADEKPNNIENEKNKDEVKEWNKKLKA
jgi:hypothetical protein